MEVVKVYFLCSFTHTLAVVSGADYLEWFGLDIPNAQSYPTCIYMRGQSKNTFVLAMEAESQDPPRVDSARVAGGIAGRGWCGAVPRTQSTDPCWPNLPHLLRKRERVLGCIHQRVLVRSKLHIATYALHRIAVQTYYKPCSGRVYPVA